MPFERVTWVYESGKPRTGGRSDLATIHPPARKDVLRRNRAELLERMAALQSALDLVEAGLNCPHEDIATCPNAGALLAKLVDGQGAG